MSVNKNKSQDSPSGEFPTVFSACSVRFPHVPENADQKISTRHFLDACSRIVIILNKLGKTFAPISYDINGNIEKVSTKYEEDPTSYEFLEDMILLEKETGCRRVADSLQWLRRALDFISHFFAAIIEDAQSPKASQDLSPFMKHAYRETLQRYHGWLSSQIFSILSRLTPSKQQLFHVFALEMQDQHEQVIKDMRDFNEGLTSCVQRLKQFYREHDLETNYRV